MIAWAVTDFPEPVSPTSPQDLSVVNIKADPGQGGDHPVPGVEGHAEVFYGQQAHLRVSSRISMISTRASPKRLNPNTVTIMASPGKEDHPG